jgi:hypothetical protein
LLRRRGHLKNPENPMGKLRGKSLGKSMAAQKEMLTSLNNPNQKWRKNKNVFYLFWVTF